MHWQRATDFLTKTSTKRFVTRINPREKSPLDFRKGYTNKLSINVKKSNFIIFRPRQNRRTLDLAFNISNYSIDRVKEATFLGVILDEHLTWKSHIHNVARKVSLKAVGITYKSSFCLNNSSLRILYFSLIYPYLFYCVSVWASTYPSNIKRLITRQKRVIRMMSRSAFDAHTDPLFKKLKNC